MKKLILLSVFLFLAFASVQVFADYESDTVVAVMRTNLSSMGALKSAVANGDFYGAAQAFMAFAEGSNKIKDFTPYRGTQAEWTATHEALINAAFEGIGACGRQDLGGVNAAFAKIGEYNKAGHGSHK